MQNEITKQGRKFIVNGESFNTKREALVRQEELNAKQVDKKEYHRNRWNARSEEEKQAYKEYRKARWNSRTEEEIQADKDYRKARYNRIKNK